ncbi:MAG: protein kinase [Acidobacteriota bacterium]|nr:protein kinase [Acidobacteriota bacterium]
MSEYDQQLERLIDEGLISPDDVDQLLSRARAENASPLTLLYEDGLCSQETLAALAKPEPVGVDVNATLDLAATQAPGNPASGPGVSLPAHYQLGELLGRGAMGKVYKALDTRLQRHVAVKFLIDDDPDLVTRFVREARAQARVEHDHLCKVFEVGEEQGRPYIVMQLIQGKTLDETAANMTLEQKLLAVKDAAEAVHQANRSGLIHRDLKPGNILVEQLADGRFKPYVMDFGLARLTTDRNLTMHGAVLGTPGYMSPEQAAGETERVDRRTDVYGLGASLYHLITGQAPFGGPSLGTLLLNIQHDMPAPPRQLKPGIPRDVEVIALKCLEKDPDSRYPSAKALAEDLGRYLDGDPIQAEPPGMLHRTALLIRKHRVLFSVVSAALLLLALSLVWGAWRASARAALERNLTQQVTRIEALARHIYMSRAHDTRSSMQRLHRRMDDLRGLMESSGRTAVGPGHYALGRGYLALGEAESALQSLETAVKEDYETPQTAYSLGLAYHRVYIEKAAHISATTDTGNRETQLQEIRQRYRAPSLTWLRSAKNHDLASDPYQQALVAFSEERFDEALKLIKETQQATPWFYEARLLQAGILQDQGRAELLSGQTEKAESMFNQALDAYERAAETAPCDPRTYNGKLYVLKLLITDEYDFQILEQHVNRFLNVTERMETIFPDRWKVALDLAWIYRTYARRLLLRGEDPSEAFDKAVSAVFEAEEKGAPMTRTANELGSIYLQIAKIPGKRPAEAEAMVGKSVDQLERVPLANRQVNWYYESGEAYRAMARFKRRSGRTPCPEYEKAFSAYTKAQAVANGWAGPLYGLALTSFDKAKARCGEQSAVDLLKQSLEYQEAAISINPSLGHMYYQKGRILRLLAQDGFSAGKSLDETYARQAMQAFETATDLSPKVPDYYGERAHLLQVTALDAWNNGKPYAEYFERGKAICREGLARLPGNYKLRIRLAHLLYFQGKFLVRQRSNPGDLLDRTIAILQEARQKVSSNDIFILLGSAYRLKAEYVMVQGNRPDRLIDSARSAFESVLRVNPKHREANRSLGRLATLEGRLLLSRGKDPTDVFNAAAVYLDKALAAGPQSPLVQVALGRLAHSQSRPASWDQGLEYLDRLLAIRPDHPEALAVKAAILRRKAELKPADMFGRQAAALWEKALAGNRHLAPEWGPELPLN